MTSAPRAHATLRSWSRLTAVLGKDVGHDDVFTTVAKGGRLGGGYLMMTAISAAIAVLGLLLSSPAVVIGAMLLSPLMGPIILLGFSFWTVDWVATRRALLSLAVGLGLALLVSILLVTLSPLKEPTSEILARSRPTLFDLLVAVFSGIAGGYAVVRQRGETVIGVAIATALMPPLATVGFGISTRAWNIAGGAGLLFLTNLIAIALAAAAVAAVTGFRAHASHTGRSWLQHAAVVAVLAALCVPLTLSLRTIALESRATAETRKDVARVFGPKARIASLSIRNQKQAMEIDGLVATPRFIPDANTRLDTALRSTLRAAVHSKLDQVVLADPSQLKPTPAPAPGGPAPRDVGADLRAAVPFSDASVLMDAAGAGEVRLTPGSGLDLQGARALEAGLRRRADFAKVAVIPTLAPLPPLPITVGAAKAPPALADAAAQSWALQRWGAAALQAGLCRRGARPPAKDLQPLLDAAFAPLPVTIALLPSQTCAAVQTPRPFVLMRAATPPPPVPAAPPLPAKAAAPPPNPKAA